MKVWIKITDCLFTSYAPVAEQVIVNVLYLTYETLS